MYFQPTHFHISEALPSHTPLLLSFGMILVSQVGECYPEEMFTSYLAFAAFLLAAFDTSRGSMAPMAHPKAARPNPPPTA